MGWRASWMQRLWYIGDAARTRWVDRAMSVCGQGCLRYCREEDENEKKERGEEDKFKFARRV
jgi:hypothetical protein